MPKKEKNNNAYVEVKKENGYEHIYISCKGFGTLQVRPIKYYSRCIYKLSKCLIEEEKDLKEDEDKLSN